MKGRVYTYTCVFRNAQSCAPNRATRVCVVGLCKSLPNEHGSSLQLFALTRAVLYLWLIIACEVEHMVLKGF